MATGPELIRIGNQHPFAVPPDRRDPPPRLRGHQDSHRRLAGMPGTPPWGGGRAAATSVAAHRFPFWFATRRSSLSLATGANVGTGVDRHLQDHGGRDKYMTVGTVKWV